MQKKLTSILRKIFSGSIAGIVAGNASYVNVYSAADNISDDEKIIESSGQKKDLSPKLLLKMSSNNEWDVKSHRSHRSHSSHRSHYSSSSSGGGSYSSSGSGSSSSSSNNGSNKSSGSSSNNSSGIVNGAVSTLKLGSRNLKLGMSGTDVTELVNILISKKYLTLKNGSTHATGVYTYNTAIEAAVKKFQKDHNLKADGECGPTTTYYLKNK